MCLSFAVQPDRSILMQGKRLFAYKVFAKFENKLYSSFRCATNGTFTPEWEYKPNEWHTFQDTPKDLVDRYFPNHRGFYSLANKDDTKYILDRDRYWSLVNDDTGFYGSEVQYVVHKVQLANLEYIGFLNDAHFNEMYTGFISLQLKVLEECS